MPTQPRKTDDTSIKGEVVPDENKEPTDEELNTHNNVPWPGY